MAKYREKDDIPRYPAKSRALGNLIGVLTTFAGFPV